MVKLFRPNLSKVSNLLLINYISLLLIKYDTFKNYFLSFLLL